MTKHNSNVSLQASENSAAQQSTPPGLEEASKKTVPPELPKDR